MCVQGEISDASMPSADYFLKGEENDAMGIKSDSRRGRKMLKILEALNVPGWQKMVKRVPPLVVLCDDSGSPTMIVFIVLHKDCHCVGFISNFNKSSGSNNQFHIAISTPYWRTGEMQRIQDFIFCQKDCNIPCTPTTLKSLPLPYFSGATHLTVLNLIQPEHVRRIYKKADDE